MRLSAAIVAAGFALLAPAIAVAQTGPAPAPVVAQPVSTGAPLICKYYYFYNNIVRRPICLTAEQWLRWRYNTQEGIREFQMRSLLP